MYRGIRSMGSGWAERGAVIVRTWGCIGSLLGPGGKEGYGYWEARGIYLLGGASQKRKELGYTYMGMPEGPFFIPSQ